jgi:hypothetical protein
MNQIPKHAELIKQWADGAKIQWHNPDDTLLGMIWQDCHNNLPTWSPKFNYRVKPKPKPDVIVYGNVEWRGVLDKRNTMRNYIGNVNSHRVETDNVMYVFDGETGVLKDVQLLAHE